MLYQHNITGKMLCQLRMAKGFAQKQVAAKLCMTQQAYSKIERSIAVKPDVLKEVLDAMHSNMEELAIANYLNFQHNVVPQHK